MDRRYILCSKSEDISLHFDIAYQFLFLECDVVLNYTKLK